MTRLDAADLDSIRRAAPETLVRIAQYLDKMSAHWQDEANLAADNAAGTAETHAMTYAEAAGYAHKSATYEDVLRELLLMVYGGAK